MILACPNCTTPVNAEELLDNGIVLCECTTKLLPTEDGSLSIQDEMPETEFLGG